MDKSQILLGKKEIQKTKTDRFSAGVSNFSILSLICISFYSVLFMALSVWQMVWVSGFCAICWAGILLINRKKIYQISFLCGVMITMAFSLFSTWLLGWDSGFFLLSFLIVPVIFQNGQMPQILKSALAFAVFAVVAGLYILSWQLPSYWVASVDLTRLLFILNLLITVVFLAITSHICELAALNAEKALLSTNKKLAELATTDPVTNLVNRRIILSRIEQEKYRMERGSKPFTLIMVDVDNFKQVNDQYGHNGGDYVLVNLAELISMSLRKQDEVARWGGDEFLIMLPETDVEGGQIVAEKIRSRILTTPFEYRETRIPVTVTLGVGTSDVGIGVGSCIRKADQALYQGKQAGKNRVGIIPEH